MRGHLRFRAGAWRLTVDAGPDPTTGKRRQLHRTVNAPDTRAGRRIAEDALAELVLKARARRGTAIDDTTTLGEYLEGYIARRSPEWAPSTQATDPGLIRRHIIGHIGDVRLADLRRRDIAHLHGILGQTLKPGSVKKVHGILHRALADAVRLELLPHNPASGVSPPKVAKSKVRAPTDAEVDAILTAAADDPGFLTLLRLDAILGSRRGEIAAIRWTDFDLDAGTVTVARSISIGPGGELVERQTKTGAVTPVAFDDGTIAEMRAHRVRRLEQAMAAGVPMDPAGFVFIDARHPRGDRPMRPDSITYRMAKAREAAKKAGTAFGGVVTFHDVRHYVASMLLADGIDIRTVAHRLGHASPNQTLATYAHLIPAADRAAAEALARRREKKTS